MLSTWTYALGVAYIFKQLALFIAFDGVIYSLCLAYLFKFSDKYYHKCCHPLEKCIIDIICCCYCCRIQREYENIDNKASFHGGTISLDLDNDLNVDIHTNSSSNLLKSPANITNPENDQIILKYSTKNDNFSSSGSYKATSTSTAISDQNVNMNGNANVNMKAAMNGAESDEELTANLTSSPSSILQEKKNVENTYNIPLKADISDNMIALISTQVENNNDPKLYRAKSAGTTMRLRDKRKNERMGSKELHRASPSPHDQFMPSLSISPPRVQLNLAEQRAVSVHWNQLMVNLSNRPHSCY